MGRKYLVTGGTGFIGAALVRRLIREGHSVCSFDNDARGSAEKLAGLGSQLSIVTGDIRDPESVQKAAANVDSVIHLAFINGTEFFYSKPDLVLDVAVRGMLNILDACKKNKIRELVLASSSEVYQTPPQVPTDETAPLLIPDVMNPRYSYAGGKLISELMAINFGRKDFHRVLIFRPHNVYGPDMGWEHVLPQFILRAQKMVKENPRGRVPFPIQGDGRQTRAFVHIDDFTDGLLCVLNKGEHLNIYHIGNPEEITIADVARKIVTRLDRDIELVPQAQAAGGTARRCPDISKLIRLGYHPRISFDEGLPSIMDWYLKNSHLFELRRLK